MQGGELDSERDNLNLCPVSIPVPNRIGMSPALVIVGEPAELLALVERLKLVITSGTVSLMADGIETLLEQHDEP